MTSGRDEVKQSMDTIVSEARVTFDTGFFSQNVIVLSFKIADDLLKAEFIVNVVAKPRSVHNRQGYSTPNMNQQKRIMFNEERERRVEKRKTKC
jgi:hypothetical protein